MIASLHRFMLLTLSGLILCTLPLPAAAELAADLANDFKPLVATLVMPAGEDWIIDADASQGLNVGDLLSVMAKGSPIVHPTTKQVIGYLDKVEAVLQVRQVKTGYSYAHALAAAPSLKPGVQAKRFEGLPALFWDYRGDGEPLYLELRSALPHLQWLPYSEAQSRRPEAPRALAQSDPALLFVYNDNGLGVKDATLQPLRFYALAALGQAPVAGAAASMQPSALTSASSTPAGIVVAPQPVGPSGGIEKAPGSGGGIVRAARTNRDGIWFSPEMKGTPVGVEVGDLDGDGQQEVALAFRERLDVYRMSAKGFDRLASMPLRADEKTLTLEGADLDGDGRPELYLTVARNESLDSRMVSFDSGKLRVLADNIPFYFRSVVLPGEGAVLLGQRTDSRLEAFGGPIFRVQRTGDSIAPGAALPLPWAVKLYEFQPFTAPDGSSLLARLNVGQHLTVLRQDGSELWESSDYYGESEVSFERKDPGSTAAIDKQPVYMRGRLTLGKQGEVLTTKHDSGLRVVESLKRLGNGRVVALQWDGYSMRELWHTQPQSGYLVDFRVADADNDGSDEVVVLQVFGRAGMFSQAHSALIVFEMQ